MRTGAQWTGTLEPLETKRWHTVNWPATWHVVWYMVPTSPQVDGPQVDWDVAVERADADYCAYWITVKNLTSNNVTFEGRYAILA